MDPIIAIVTTRSVSSLNLFSVHFQKKPSRFTNVMRCAIWYHLYNLKNVRNTHGGMLSFTKSNTPPWVFFTFFKLDKCYQIAQRNTCFVLVFAVCLFIVLMARVLIKYPLTLFDHFVYFFLCMWGFICWVSIIGPEIPICFEGLFFKFILKFKLQCGQ